MVTQTTAAETVADDYRIEQAVIAGQAAATATAALRMLDPMALSAGFGTYLAAVMALVDQSRHRVALAAGAFYTSHRRASGIRASHPAVAYAGSLPRAQVATAALVTGPVTAKRAILRGEPVSVALSKAERTTYGAVYRLTANAGRETIRDTVRRDPVALGWGRMTDGDPCAFCAMLASRGAVYLSAGNAHNEDDPYHDGCGCYPVPLYSRSAPIPGRAKEFENLWETATKNKSGKDAINAFRRAYTAQQRAAQ